MNLPAGRTSCYAGSAPESTIARVRDLAADGHTLAEIANDLTKIEYRCRPARLGFGRRRKSARCSGEEAIGRCELPSLPQGMLVVRVDHAQVPAAHEP